MFPVRVGGAGGIRMTATANSDLSTDNLAARLSDGVVGKAVGLSPVQKNSGGLQRTGHLFYCPQHDVFFEVLGSANGGNAYWTLYDGKTLAKTANNTLSLDANAGYVVAAGYSPDLNVGFFAVSSFGGTTGYVYAFTVTSASTVSWSAGSSVTLSATSYCVAGAMVDMDNGSGGADAILVFERGSSQPYYFLITVTPSPSVATIPAPASPGGSKPIETTFSIGVIPDPTNNRLMILHKENSALACWATVLTKYGGTVSRGVPFQFGTHGTDAIGTTLLGSYDEVNDNFAIFSSLSGNPRARIVEVTGVEASATISGSGGWVSGTITIQASSDGYCFAGCHAGSDHVYIGQSNGGGLPNGLAAFSVRSQSGTGTPTKNVDAHAIDGFGLVTTYLGGTTNTIRGGACAFVQPDFGNRLVGSLPGLNSPDHAIVFVDLNAPTAKGGAAHVVGRVLSDASADTTVTISTGEVSTIDSLSGFTAGDVLYCDAQGGVTTTDTGGGAIAVAIDGTSAFLVGNGEDIAKLKQEEA